MRNRAFFGCFVVFCLVLAMSAPTSSGQAVYGGILGTVTDGQGNAVAGAKVIVTSVAKGTIEETATHDDGTYSVSHLIPDTYDVRIEATGFKSYDVKAVLVSADSSSNVDAKMDVGSVSQSIEVTGEVPQLKIDRSDVSTTFSAQTVESIPIYNRNFTTLQLLSPGNAQLGWGHAASENPQGSQQILTQGQHFAGTGFELDGTDNQDPILGIIVINPNLEAINEVKITAQDYDAEFGKAIGAVVTTQTKSGTNELHGTLFDFQRSNSNFARDPLTQTPTAGVPSGNWNQFGVAAGGPIKKNKLFVFGDYQGLRSHVGATASDRVPTAAERTGDLSDLLSGCATNTNPCVPIFDPYMTTDGTHSTLLLDASGQPIPLATSARTQFPGNVIPASRLSAQAQTLLGLIPGSNATPTNILNDNFFGSGSNVLDSNGFDIRSDFAATSKVQIFGRYSFQKFLRAGPGLFGTEVGGAALPADPSVGNFAGTSNVKNQSVAAGFDYTLSSTLLTDFRFGYMRYHVQTAPGGVGTTPATDAGIPGLNLSDNFYTSGMPAFIIHTPNEQDQFAFGYSLGVNQCNCPLTESEHQYQFVNNWTKIQGKHTIKFGADGRYAYNLRVPSDAHRAGQLDFNNDITQGPTGGGAGLAGFLLGDVSHFARYVSNSTNAYETQPRIFFYGQDTWRITPKLTLNAGLRWEIYKPESAARAGGGGFVDLKTGEVRVAGQNGVDLNGNTSTDYKHFAPRLGIAYQVNAKTVVRIGYGRSYDIGVFGSVFGHTITQNLPVLGQQDYAGSGAGAQDFNTAFFLNNGPASFDPTTKLTVGNCNAVTDPTGTLTECVGPNGNPLLPNGVFSRARPFNNRLPTVDAWNASVQRQVTPTLTATVAYVGNKGTHTLIGDNPAYGINNRTTVGYAPGCVDGPSGPLNCLAGQLTPHERTPFFASYGWTQGIDYFGNDADNHYNSLQITVDKRFSNGLSFNSSYTFQHAVYYNNDSYFNIDKKLEYGPNSSYRDHVFILTQVYELPFGRGKKWGSGMGRAADFVIGGWSLNSSTNFSSGLPYTPSISSCTQEIDTGNGAPCKPDLIGSVKGGARSGDPKASGYWFETAATPLKNQVCPSPTSPAETPATSGPWGQPDCGLFGNVGYNSFRGPKFFNTSAALFKDFTFTERFKAQFQFQAFNVFNHVNLALPNTNVDGGGGITDIAFGSQMRRLQFGLKLNF
jgi:outer membrane receptor protein involved in Fe transport